MKRLELLAGIIMLCGPAATADSVKLVVEPFPLGQVRLLDSAFKQNMERDVAYLLSLEPDRLLHNTRQYCGLEPKAPLYGGWEARGVAGQTLGHYLTAISQQYAATGDQRFRQRIDYIVSEMAECQKRYGDGYIGALPPVELAALRKLKDGDPSLANAWVPWYTEHKVLAGLKDAWVLGGNQQAKEVAMKLGDWIGSITAGLSPQQLRIMLRTEFGGMSESLVELYALTGEQRYLETSRRFYDHAVLDALLAGRDELPGKHANTQIPKIVGEARRYETTGDADSRKIAEYFWDTVVHHHSYVIGGNSDREHFFPENESPQHLGPETAETCNTYNMLRLTEHLIEWNPDAAYGDYFERALYNQILPSQEPEHGMFTYFVSLKPGHFKTYSDPTNSFWCCVGTGIENHTKYGKAIYYHNNDALYVNLFIPSELDWKEKKLLLEQKNSYPEKPETELTFKTAPSEPLALKVRCPAWISAGMTFQLNGKPLSVDAKPGQFAEIKRAWQAGDKLQVTIPMALHTELLPGTSNKVAFLYGPLVLAGDLGPAPKTRTYPYAADQTANDLAATADVPALVTENSRTVVASLKRASGGSLSFTTDGLAKPRPVTLRPLKDIAYNYYNVYWDVVSPSEWTQIEKKRQQIAEQRRADEARIVDEFVPGEQQSEADHRLAGERSETGPFSGRNWRHAQDGGYFSFEMKVLPGVAQVLRCTYWGEEVGARTFDILVDGKVLATQSLGRDKPGEFYDIEYPLPRDTIAGKDHITVRFQPHAGNMAGGLFGAAVMKVK